MSGHDRTPGRIPAADYPKLKEFYSGLVKIFQTRNSS